MSLARPRRVSPMHHHAVVTLTFAEVGTCMDRWASTRITGSPRITDQLRISQGITVRIATPDQLRIRHVRITSPGSRPDHVLVCFD